MTISKRERSLILRAVNDAWVDFNFTINQLPERLYRLAADVLMVLDDEPWRGFGDVLNEVLDY